MEKRLACRDMGSDYSFVVCAKKVEEIFEEVRFHTRTVHHTVDVSKEFYDEARSAIRDVPVRYRGERWKRQRTG